jgi:hypothetical protein
MRRLRVYREAPGFRPDPCVVLPARGRAGTGPCYPSYILVSPPCSVRVNLSYVPGRARYISPGQLSTAKATSRCPRSTRHGHKARMRTLMRGLPALLDSSILAGTTFMLPGVQSIPPIRRTRRHHPTPTRGVPFVYEPDCMLVVYQCSRAHSPHPPP